jgi:hypothetical protein
MQRIKIFSSASCGDDLAQLERLVNDWLAATTGRAVQIVQSAQGEHLVITVVFAEGDEETAQPAEAAVEVPEVFERTLGDATLDPEGPAEQPLPELELPY